MLTITDFDPYRADEFAWEDYYNFCTATVGNFLERDEFKSWITERLKGNNSKVVLIYGSSGLAIVIRSLFKKSVSGDDIPFIEIETVLTELSSQQSKIIAKGILRLIGDAHAKSIRISTANPVIMGIIYRFDGKVINTKNFYQLYRNQFNNTVANGWRVNADIASGNVRLVTYDFVPEELYDKFARLITELMNDIIREDSQELFMETGDGIKQKMEILKKTGVKMLTLLLFDLQENLIGISFVQLFPGSTTAKQYMTGIKKQFRGKKLACYLKAMITDKTFSRFPNIEKMETDCYDANKPMIHINELAGYRFNGNSFQFSVYIEKLKEYISISLA